MITISSVDMTSFNAGLQGLARLGIPMAKIISKETGELIKELVRLSPPRKLSKSKERAAKDARAVFRPISKDYFDEAKAGKKGIRWLYASPFVLVGTEREYWKPGIDGGEAHRFYQKHKQTMGKASVRLGKRGKQIVSLSDRAYVKRTILNEVINHIRRNFGRLKAGWLVAVGKGPIRLSGRNMPPGWVTKHIQGARGRFEDGLANTSKPSFTIANSALGITSEFAKSTTQAAVKNRAHKMLGNVKQYLKGKKNLADYARN